MLTDFLKYLQVERNYSVQTVRAYGDDLRQFFSFCAIDPYTSDISTISHRTIRSWLSFLLETGNTARSVNRKLSSLRSFYKYLIKTSVVKVNPLSKVVAPKMTKKLPVFLSQAESNKMLDDIKYSDDFSGIRDLLIVELFYFTGVRVSELTNLKTKDVDLNGLTIKVMGKGAKERIIPMHPELKPLMVDYISQKDELFPLNQTPYLVVTSSGGKPYTRLLYRIVNKYMTMVTSLEKKSPHVLRHTFATQLLNQGADINAIKELLGHANLSATQVYTHTSIDKLKLAYKQAHPRA
jgi:integrase/recombinase XerC